PQAASPPLPPAERCPKRAGASASLFPLLLRSALQTPSTRPSDISLTNNTHQRQPCCTLPMLTFYKTTTIVHLTTARDTHGVDNGAASRHARSAHPQGALPGTATRLGYLATHQRDLRTAPHGQPRLALPGAPPPRGTRIRRRRMDHVRYRAPSAPVQHHGPRTQV